MGLGVESEQSLWVFRVPTSAPSVSPAPPGSGEAGSLLEGREADSLLLASARNCGL